MRCIVVCFAAVAITALAPAARAQDAGVALPPLSVRTAAYEIYAGDSATLRTARIDLDSAIARFRRYFGREPGPLAVVYLQATGNHASLSTTQFAARGFRTIPMIAPSSLNVGPSATQVAEGRALAHEACHQFLIDYVDARQAARGRPRPTQSDGGVYGHPDIPDWFDEAVATLCEEPSQMDRRLADIRARFDERITLAELFTMRHPTSARTDRSLSVTSQAAPGDTAGRKIQVLDMNGRDISADSDFVAKLRRAVAGDSTAGIRLQRADSGTAPRASEMMTTTVSRMDRAASGRVLAFYGESNTVARFIAAKAGDRAIGRMADGLAEGRTTSAVLASMHGVPPDLAAFDREWRDWLFSR